jgi:hypothetical protein
LRFGIDSNSARSPLIHSFPFQWFTDSLLDLTLTCKQLFEAFLIRIFVPNVYVELNPKPLSTRE